MNSPRPADVTGIILAGGDSSRFGSDKALKVLNGRTLLERASGVLAPYCAEILVSSGNPAHDHFGFRRVPDEIPGRGPMMGIYSALRSSKTAMNLLIAVDNIHVDTSFFSYILSKDLQNCDAAVPWVQNRYFEPLVGFYSKNILKRMSVLMQENNFRLPDLLQHPGVMKLDVEGEFPGFHKDYFCSVNEPGDLQGVVG